MTIHERYVRMLLKGFYSLFEYFYHRTRAKFVLNIIANYRGRVACDLGCDVGLLTGHIEREIGFKTYLIGTDIDKKSVKGAKTTYPKIEFIIADATIMPIRNDVFSLILCLETLEHVTTPELALKEIQRVSTEGGVLILSVPAESSLSFKIFKFVFEGGRGSHWFIMIKRGSS
jgi:ubiquinone/menaquinone biosynthesis C-methylase UbiE